MLAGDGSWGVLEDWSKSSAGERVGLPEVINPFDDGNAEALRGSDTGELWLVVGSAAVAKY